MASSLALGASPGAAAAAPSSIALEGDALLVELRGPALFPAAVARGWSGPARRAYARALRDTQARLAARLEARGVHVRARYHRLINGLAVIAPEGSARAWLSAQPEVASVASPRRLRLAAIEAQASGVPPLTPALGLTGAGVRVGIIDGGVDYLLPALGGPGGADAYAAQDPSTLDDGAFPNGVVVGGWDFVGADGLSPDADPAPDGLADLAPESPAHHGTAVAATVAAIAPGAQLWALKIFSGDSREVTSDVLLEALEYAADPNGDDSPDDALDVVLLALASTPIGLDDDWDISRLHQAIEGLDALGSLVVTAAGNAGPRPLSIAAPGAFPEVLCVGASYPAGLSLREIEIASPPAAAGRYPVRVAASASLEGGAAGPLWAPSDACDPDAYGGAPPDAWILARASACAPATLSANAAAAGAIGVLAAVPPGLLETWPAPPVASPPLLLIGADGAGLLARALEAGAELPLSVRPPAPGLALTDTALTTSARGPGQPYHAAGAQRLSAKPDLVAPGYLIEAPLAGPGGRRAAFTGTSLAAAQVAAVAALLREARPDRGGRALKASLMNTAAPAWSSSGALVGGALAYGGAGELAPLTRVGAGRVDPEAALAAAVTASAGLGVTLDFGLVAAAEPLSVGGSLTLTNEGNTTVSYQIEARFRSGGYTQVGVSVTLDRGTVEIPAGGEVSLPVQIQVDPRALPLWPLSEQTWSSPGPRLGEALSRAEVDGALRFTPLEGAGPILRAPFYLIPRRVAEVHVADGACVAPADFELRLDNTSATAGRSEAFTLAFMDPAEPDIIDALDLRAVGVRFEARGDVQVLQVAVTTEGWAPLPASQAFYVMIDLDADGLADFVLAPGDEGELAGGLATGVAQTLILAPDDEGALASPFGRFRLVDSTFAQAELFGAARIFSAPLDALAIGPGADLDLWIYGVGGGVAGGLLDSAPLHGARPALEAGDAIHIDTSCQLWSLSSPRVFVAERGRLLLDAAPTCQGDAEGILLLHTGAAPSALPWEVVTPPSAADFSCEARMLELADADSCEGTPDWGQFVHGACDGAISVEPLGTATSFGVGETPVTLEITDPWGNKQRCDTVAEIEDRVAPEVDCGALTALDLQTGLLPVDHRVGGADACGEVEARIVGWRCLLGSGAELYDLSSTCAVGIDGDTLHIVDLGRSADRLEWTVIATDPSGNEGLKTCVAAIDRDVIAAQGGGGCGGGGSPASRPWAQLLALGLIGAWARRHLRRGSGAKG